MRSEDEEESRATTGEEDGWKSTREGERDLVEERRVRWSFAV